MTLLIKPIKPLRVSDQVCEQLRDLIFLEVRFSSG